MKKNICLIFGLVIFIASDAQNIEGNWGGSLNISGNLLALLFHFEKNSDGSYKTTFDSPTQEAYGLKTGTTIIKEDSLLIGIPQVAGGYYGKIHADSITGIWKQGKGSLPLILHRSTIKPAAAIVKPQTPVPPYPYNSSDVIYTNADKTITYGATLTYPKNSKNLPAVVLINGSGQQDRDCSIMGHKWFLVLADHLTKNGFAVLRVDDRGKGETTGDVMKATSADFAYDVEQGINYLKTQPEINQKKIGLVGHSEGGMIAPMVAARNKAIACIVMLAGPGIGGATINEEQNVLAQKKSGLSDSAIAAFRLQHRALQKAAINAKTDAEFAQMVQNVVAKKYKQAGKNDAVADSVVASTIAQYNSLRIPWFKFFMAYNPTIDIAKLQIPVLAINGSKDTQVDAAQNLPVIKKALLKNKSPFTKTQIMPGLNHLFQQAITGQADEYGKIEETINPKALQTISDWLKLVNK